MSFEVQRTQMMLQMLGQMEGMMNPPSPERPAEISTGDSPATNQ
jgi:hypothetical protein